MFVFAALPLSNSLSISRCVGSGCATDLTFSVGLGAWAVRCAQQCASCPTLMPLVCSKIRCLQVFATSRSSAHRKQSLPGKLGRRASCKIRFGGFGSSAFQKGPLKLPRWWPGVPIDVGFIKGTGQQSLYSGSFQNRTWCGILKVPRGSSSAAANNRAVEGSAAGSLHVTNPLRSVNLS